MCSKQNRRFNLSVFNMITWVITSKILAKDISCKCKLDSMGKKCNSDHWQNNNKCRYQCEKRHVCEKIYIFEILLYAVVKMEII